MSNQQIKVGMLILMEHDLEAAVEFYKKLGFQLKFHIKQKWAEFSIGSVKIGLCPTSQEPFDKHTGIVLEVTDIRKLQEDIENKGLVFLTEIKESVHGLMTGIKDPNGNILDLYQPTPEKVKEFVKDVMVDKQCCKNDSKDCSCSPDKTGCA